MGQVNWKYRKFQMKIPIVTKYAIDHFCTIKGIHCYGELINISKQSSSNIKLDKDQSQCNCSLCDIFHFDAPIQSISGLTIKLKVCA